jgi:RNA polymerase sigma-70 factor (ECF subfamily)
VSGENDFVRDLRRGVPAAYEALVCQFETPLYRYFLAAHGDPQLAGEQSVDCFGDLVESLPKMTGGGEQLRPFVFAVARNVLRRRWRVGGRERGQPISAETACDRLPAPDVALEAREESARVIEAIRSLDPPTRDVFLMRFLEQMSVAEVAAAVGEPVGTVKSRLHRGRKQLSEILRLSSECHERKR